MFIAFEGLDGSGSSTQSKLLAEKLQAQGREVLLTKEPTSDTALGREIREILQHKREIFPEELQRLFAADRKAHVEDLIEPALREGKTVITDRYLFSTLAYGALEVDMEKLKNLNKNFRLPDLTFLFKLSPEECLERILSRGSEVELFEKISTLKKVWENYERISTEYENIHIIDASRSIEEISEEIYCAIKINKL